MVLFVELFVSYLFVTLRFLQTCGGWLLGRAQPSHMHITHMMVISIMMVLLSSPLINAVNTYYCNDTISKYGTAYQPWTPMTSDSSIWWLNDVLSPTQPPSLSYIIIGEHCYVDISVRFTLYAVTYRQSVGHPLIELLIVLQDAPARLVGILEVYGHLQLSSSGKLTIGTSMNMMNGSTLASTGGGQLSLSSTASLWISPQANVTLVNSLLLEDHTSINNCVYSLTLYL
jgi:hypothetical protein